MTGDKARAQAGFQFHVNKEHGPDPGSGPLPQKPHLNSRTESHQVTGKSSDHAYDRYADYRKKGSCGSDTLDVLQSTTS